MSQFENKIMNRGMKSYKTFITFLTFSTFVTLVAHAQQWTDATKEEVAKEFESAVKWYSKTPAYSMNVTHSSYENYETDIPYERKSGYFKKDNTNYHSFLLGLHTIQNSSYKIVVDTSGKLMMVGYPDKAMEEIIGIKDYEEKLEMCAALKKMESANGKIYRLEFDSDSPIKAYEVAIYPQGMVKELVIYYNTEIKKDADNPDSEAVKPRMVISFSNYNANVKFKYNEEFSEANYIVVNKDKKLSLGSRYKGYELNDQRLMVQ